MFCLRGYVLPLLFLSSASPLYLILFLSAFWILQRPCVYCSLLLAILVTTTYDFSQPWFPTTEHDAPTCSPLKEALDDAASIFGLALNGTASGLVEAVSHAVQRRTESRWNWSRGLGGFGTEWIRNVAQRREIRIPCMNAIIRL